MNLLNFTLKKDLLRGLFFLLLLGFISTSCSDDAANDADDIQQDLTEVERASQIDQIDDTLGDLVIEAYEQQEISESGRSSYTSGIPGCVTITIVAQQNYREVTLDFGTEGCIVNGHVLTGQIVFDYTRDPEAQQIMINYNLVAFTFDAKQVLGSRTIMRELSNANGNPHFTHTLDLTVVGPDGVQASREGTRIREWTQGFGTGVYTDNVFEITGDWTAHFVNGNTHTYEVITALRREATCSNIVSGSVDVQRTNFGGIFDFGDGSCDNQATFTFNNGTEIPITLN